MSRKRVITKITFKERDWAVKAIRKFATSGKVFTFDPDNNRITLMETVSGDDELFDMSCLEGVEGDDFTYVRIKPYGSENE